MENSSTKKKLIEAPEKIKFKVECIYGDWELFNDDKLIYYLIKLFLLLKNLKRLFLSN
jgi:hypothetical protein